MLCQLRCGILALRIETGRYGPKPLPPEDHICLLCNSGPETELHFLFHCNLYHQQRQTFYAFVNSINPQFTYLDVLSKFDLIMNNPKVIKRTAQFIVTCYDVLKTLFQEYLVIFEPFMITMGWNHGCDLKVN